MFGIQIQMFVLEDLKDTTILEKGKSTKHNNACYNKGNINIKIWLQTQFYALINYGWFQLLISGLITSWHEK